jgi:PAS domain S-box-containing protein
MGNSAMETAENVDLKELKSRHSLLKDLMDCIPDVIYFKDKKGRLVLVNQAHAKGLGLSPEDVIGKTDFDIFPKNRAEKMNEDDLQVINTGKPIIDKIERATRSDGIDNYVSTTKIPRYNEDGEIIGLIGITRDITSRMQLMQSDEERERIKKKLENLEELNKLKSEFVSKVSHELRTPLAIIKESINLTVDEILGAVTDKQKDVLTKANECVGRLQRMIEEMLDISRIETGKLRLHYSLVNFNDLITDSLPFFKKLAFDRGIRLDYYLPRKNVNIFIDSERVIQVINNLLDNAIKFTESNGSINFKLKILESKIRIDVSDTGIGISKNDLPKLFNKFTQVSNKHDKDNKGVGLGLSIAKEIVEKHGGEIWAESKIGIGSRFCFTLPKSYRVDALHSEARARINSILKAGKNLYFINLSVINFQEIIKKIKQKKLGVDFKNIIESTFKMDLGPVSDGFEIIWMDPKKGEYSIIMPNAEEQNILRGIDSLKSNIKMHFMQKKIEDVFVNIGKISYPLSKSNDVIQIADNLYIKKIFIGLEKRQFKRIYYNMEIEVSLPVSEMKSARTIDISLGGICFASSKKLEIGKEVEIKIKLPKMDNVLCVLGTIAWSSPADSISDNGDKYKTGIEFKNINKKTKKILSDFIQEIAPQA